MIIIVPKVASRYNNKAINEFLYKQHKRKLFIFFCLFCFVTSPAQDITLKEPVVAVADEKPVVETKNKTQSFALKTNLLLDAIAIPSIGLEIYLGKNWSTTANWHYAWWRNESRSWWWRTYGGDIVLRRWFGSKAAEKPLAGHHVGMYGQILTYDFALGGPGYLGDKWTYGAGLEYGYSLPIRKRLRIDFTLGLGYLGGEYEEYLPMDEEYVWQATRNRRWFGPTKAEISLVWLLGRVLKAMEKGDKR